MGIFLLRMLLGIWMIPFLLIVGVPIWWIMSGFEESISCFKNI